MLRLRSFTLSRSILEIRRSGIRYGSILNRNNVSYRLAPPRTFCSVPGFEPPVVKRAFPPLPDEDVNSDCSFDSDSNVYSGVNFSSIDGLSAYLLERLNRLGFQNAFEVQAKTLPHTLNGRDVIGRAVTGSGKTLAFAIPIVEKLSSSARRSHPRAIVIAPTRELCKQVMESVASLSDKIRCVALYGGDSYSRQLSSLERGVDVVCATPGRLKDHLQRGSLRLDNIEFLVLDEADELLTPNFKLQIDIVLTSTPRDKQMMLFSATMPPDIRQLIREHMSDPVVVDLVENRSVVPSTVLHQVMIVDPYTRDQVLVNLLYDRKPTRAIVFTPRKVLASSLARYLTMKGISAGSLHSDMSQSARESCLDNFRKGYIKVITATDVAARGIDIPEIDLVIQIDPPPSGLEYYIHRSGRTGRKGLSGTSLLLLHKSHLSEEFFMELQKSINVEFLSQPSHSEVSKTLLDNATADIRNANPKLSAKARAHAEEILKDTNEVDALASALSCLAFIKTKEQQFERSRGFGNPVEWRRGGGYREWNSGYRQSRGGNRKSHDQFGRSKNHFDDRPKQFKFDDFNRRY